MGQLITFRAIHVTSIGSGQLIGKFGRYRPFPIAGTALMMLGLLLLSGIGVTTPMERTAIYTLVLGAGLGMTMQVLGLAAQNAVPYELLGVATSGSTLFRHSAAGVRRGVRSAAATRVQSTPRRR